MLDGFMAGDILHYKQRALLAVVDELSVRGKSSRLMIEKNLFLLKKEEALDEDMKFYNFFPYKYGPFSNMSYFDLNGLRLKGYLDEDEKNPRTTEKAKDVLTSLNQNVRQKIAKTAERFESDNAIKSYVYGKYPEYTVKSENSKIKRNPSSPGIFTIGYEGRDIDSFLDSLIRCGVEVLVDVRRNPFSMNLSFTQKKLSEYLNRVEIVYKHIPELGIDGELRKNLETPEDYQKLFEGYKESLKEKKKELGEIVSLGGKNMIALMCFEHDKNMCHRGVIAEYLGLNNIQVGHL
ncbi:MAG: DUF488 family protein [Candidatus Altiarchaeota archaeon]